MSKLKIALIYRYNFRD